MPAELQIVLGGRLDAARDRCQLARAAYLAPVPGKRHHDGVTVKDGYRRLNILARLAAALLAVESWLHLYRLDGAAVSAVLEAHAAMADGHPGYLRRTA
jgi:hypothetical protein